MDELVNALIHCLGQINPLYAVIAVAVYAVFGKQLGAILGGLLSRIKLPKLPSPAPAPDAPKAEPSDELEQWLENHPLLDRLWQRLKEKYKDVANGEADEDELYVKLLEALKKVE